MKTSIEIKDDKQIELINALRGEKSAKDFVHDCFAAGLKLADMQRRQKAKPTAKALRFENAKPEFKTLDVAAITAALKEKNPKNPVTLEVSRLVGAYTAQLRDFARQNGNRLPASLRVNTKVAIEKVAFQITAEAIKHAVKNAKKQA